MVAAAFDHQNLQSFSKMCKKISESVLEMLHSGRTWAIAGPVSSLWV